MWQLSIDIFIFFDNKEMWTLIFVDCYYLFTGCTRVKSVTSCPCFVFISLNIPVDQFLGYFSGTVSQLIWIFDGAGGSRECFRWTQLFLLHHTVTTGTICSYQWKKNLTLPNIWFQYIFPNSESNWHFEISLWIINAI